MKILIPHFEVTGIAAYPDNAEEFTNMQEITLGKDKYWQCDYSGSLKLETGTHTYNSMLLLKPKIINIVIDADAVTNTLTGFDDKDNEYTVIENSNSVATGKGLAMLFGMGLKKFRVPFLRTDTGAKREMVADIAKDGTFSILLNFKTGGHWVVNSELLNSELSDAELKLFKFNIDEHKFKVV